MITYSMFILLCCPESIVMAHFILASATVAWSQPYHSFLLAVVDLVLIMSVNPGFGGQSFIESQVKKIRDLRQMCEEKVGSDYPSMNL